MGKLGQEFAAPTQELLDDLLRAYADEWFGHYNYNLAARLLIGPSSAAITPLLREMSTGALARADRLADRLLELGAQPVAKLTELPDKATPKSFKLPEDLTDGAGLLRAVLDAERTSLRTFKALLERTQHIDPLTAELALHLLGDAARGEQTIEDLLGDAAAEMDGR